MAKKPAQEESPIQDIVVAISDLNHRIAALNKEFAVVLRGNSVFIMRHWVGSDGVSQLRFFDRKGFELLMANKKYKTDDNKWVPLSKLWLESPIRQEFEDVYFRPCDKDYPTRYNLWQGFAFKAIKNNDNIESYLSHIKDNICNGDTSLYEWVISFMADIIQKPWRKSGTALVLRGEMGVGKGVFAYHFGKLFGTHYLPVTQFGQITGRFNSHLAGKVLVFMDEGSWSQDKYGEGILRALITEPQLTIEGKGRDAICMDNFCHLIIAANHDYVVPTGMGDERRMASLDVGSEKQRDTKYFKKIEDDMNAGGYEALLYFFQNYQYDENIVRTIPKTQALLDQKFHSMTLEVKWWHSCLSEERIGDKDIPDEFKTTIETKTVYNSYVKFCETMKQKPLSDNELPKKLKKFVEFIKIRRGMKLHRIYEYELDTIANIREKFEVAIGAKMEWPVEIE